MEPREDGTSERGPTVDPLGCTSGNSEEGAPGDRLDGPGVTDFK